MPAVICAIKTDKSPALSNINIKRICNHLQQPSSTPSMRATLTSQRRHCQRRYLLFSESRGSCALRLAVVGVYMKRL